MLVTYNHFLKIKMMADSKTAMQDQIDFLIKHKEDFDSLMPMTYGILINNAVKLLEKERQQIIASFNKGFKDGYDADIAHNEFKDGKDYFTQTYKQ